MYTESMLAIILDFYGVIFDPTTHLPMSGVVEFLQLAKQKNIPCAVASSSDSRSIQDFLEEYHLSEYIQVIVGGDKVEALKPDPECYVSAADYLQFQYSDCFIIDDTLAPLQQAEALGFQIIHFKPGETSFLGIAQLVGLSSPIF